MEQRGGGQVGDRGALGGQLDDLHSVAGDRVPQAEEQDGQLLLQIRADQQHGATGRADVIDRGPGEAEHDLRGQPVAELRIDVVGAQHALGQLGPGEHSRW